MHLQPLSKVDQANLLIAMRLGRIRHHMARIEDSAQDFTLVNQQGNFVNLFDQLDDGPVVLAFVNGNDMIEGHNIVCQLGRLRSSLDNYNASLMLVAPHSKAMDGYKNQCTKFDIDILHDVGNRVAVQFGLLPEPTNYIHEFYEDFAIGDTWIRQCQPPLPVAALYAIKPDRRIAFSYVKTEDTFAVNKQELFATLM